MENKKDLKPTTSHSNTPPVEKRNRKVQKRKIVFSRIKRKALKHVWPIRLLILIGLVLGFYFVFLVTTFAVRDSKAAFYAGLLSDFIRTPEQKIISFNDRTNILILGKGGGSHEAPDLTDTIIFASVNHRKPSITLVSLPRDIWIPELRAKLNSVYYWGNQKETGGGLVLSRSVVEKITAQPVHYVLVIDFAGFQKIVDQLGGIKVDVKTPFVDERFPVPGRENDSCDGDREYRCRYETIRFEKGVQLMDGETALKFVRSRNADGDEGTDFARSARQQLVIKAVKEKVLSREIITSPKRILSLWETVKNITETDLNSSVAAILLRRVYQARNSVNSYVLPEELLIHPRPTPRYDNLYVFTPKAGNWSEVGEWLKNLD